MGVVKCKVLGVIQFVDGGEMDYKIIGLDADYPNCREINEIADLKKTVSFATAEAEILNWLKYYKTVDNDGNKIKNHEKKLGKYIVDRPSDSYEARKVIKECRKCYDRIVNCAIQQQKEKYKKLNWSSSMRKSESMASLNGM